MKRVVCGTLTSVQAPNDGCDHLPPVSCGGRDVVRRPGPWVMQRFSRVIFPASIQMEVVAVGREKPGSRMAFCVSVRGASGGDESHILLICGLRGTYRVLITFRAYVTYFRTFSLLILTEET